MTRNATGTVRRLNVAVVVNHRSNTDAQPARPAVHPLTADELEKLTALVQEASASTRSAVTRCGWSTRRSGRRHARAEPTCPIWQQPWVMDLLRAAARRPRWCWWR
jgi:flagellar M-ring protein FliF